jgi:hypothetical protein
MEATIADLMARLHRAGVRVWADDDQLRFSAPSGALDRDLRAELAAHKDIVLTLLRAARSSSGTMGGEL